MTYGESSNFEKCILLNNTGKEIFILMYAFYKEENRSLTILELAEELNKANITL